MTKPLVSLAAEFLYYNRWANLKLIDACCSLAPEQLASSVSGVYGSISKTLEHIVRSEAGYYRRITGVTLDPPFAWDAAPALPEIRAYAERVESELVQAAEQMQPMDALPRTWGEAEPEWDGYPRHFRAAAMLIQVVNHGVEHRTNITTILAHQGIETPDLDGWEYMRSNPDRMGA
jgi:uncharacterized damage-inducible protein DinB